LTEALERESVTYNKYVRGERKVPGKLLRLELGSGESTYIHIIGFSQPICL
jgi:hypothetical protein